MRVLVFNDSPTVGANLVAALGVADDLEVVGVFHDADDAVSVVAAHRPHVVLMDVVMPGKGGLQATRELVAHSEVPVVLMSSVVDTSDGAVVIDALSSGAVCIVDIPPGPSDPAFRSSALKLAQLVRTMARTAGRAPPTLPSFPPPVAASQVDFVAVVASAGGPGAVVELFGHLPRGMPPMLLVQHLPGTFVPAFAEWLSDRVARPVVVVSDEAEPRSDHVYVAAPDRHLVVDGPNRLGVSAGPRVHGFRPSGTVLFESVARVAGRRALGVVLTGMGTDGSDGAVAIRRAGGRVAAQDGASAAVNGMPAAAVAAGGVDVQLRLDQLGAWLVRCATEPRA